MHMQMSPPALTPLRDLIGYKVVCDVTNDFKLCNAVD